MIMTLLLVKRDVEQEQVLASILYVSCSLIQALEHMPTRNLLMQLNYEALPFFLYQMPSALRYVFSFSAC